MLLKQLELENFRQYKGKQSVEFSTDPEKNVTLILGKNTSGKTTIIQAFRWILYDDTNFTGHASDRDNILNNDVKRSMRQGEHQYTSATLTFIHQQITYTVKRQYEYISKISGDAKYNNFSFLMYYYDENGEKKQISGADAKIDEILPNTLSEYFFFDGEKIANSRKRDNVRDSINTIMGLVPLERMIGHLYSDSGRSDSVERTYRELMKNDSGTADINRNINKKNDELNQYQEQLTDAKEKWQIQDDALNRKNAEFIQIENIAQYAEERKTVEGEIEEKKEELKNGEEQTMAAFSPMMTELFLNYLSKSILEDMKDLDYSDKGIPEMTAASVKFIIDRGRCICGQNLTNNEKCLHELKELLTYLPPESIGSQIRHLSETLENYKDMNHGRIAFENYHEYYLKNIEELEKLESRYADLSDKIGENKDADIIKKEYDATKSLRNAITEEISRYDYLYRKTKNEKEELEHTLSTAAANDSYNKELMDKIAYAKALYIKAKKEYENSSVQILEVVRKTLKEVFKKMYHGERTIELSDDYNISLNVEGAELDKSKGLETVQNFAFISSLLKVAKDRASLEFNSESYPLAMDAVFSNTDEIHIKNICNELPNLAEQAILALMDKDWRVARTSLEKHVGKKYRIDKKTETLSTITEES